MPKMYLLFLLMCLHPFDPQIFKTVTGLETKTTLQSTAEPKNEESRTPDAKDSSHLLINEPKRTQFFGYDAHTTTSTVEEDMGTLTQNGAQPASSTSLTSLYQTLPPLHSRQPELKTYKSSTKIDGFLKSISSSTSLLDSDIPGSSTSSTSSHSPTKSFKILTSLETSHRTRFERATPLFSQPPSLKHEQTVNTTTIQHVHRNDKTETGFTGWSSASPQIPVSSEPAVRRNFSSDEDLERNSSRFEISFKDCDQTTNTDPKNITADHGTVDIFRTYDENLKDYKGCVVKLVGTPGKFLFVSFTDFDCPQIKCQMMVRTCQYTDPQPFLLGVYFSKKPPNLYSSTNCLYFSIIATEKWYKLRVVFTFSSVTSVPELPLVYTTKRSGFITSPFFDGVSKCCPSFRRSTKLTLPADYSFLLLSFVTLKLGSYYSEQCVAIYKATASGNDNLLSRHCSQDMVEIEKFNTSVIIEYVTAVGYGAVGFKMLFSFYTQEDIPQLTDSGRFNCSGKTYELFKQHVQCNVRTECEYNEDERDCSYSSADCNGAISYGNSCYSYIAETSKLTWNEANLICNSKNARLVSLNTVEEMNAVLNAVQHSSTWGSLYIGLRTSNPNRPKMYRQVLRWMDGKTAFDFKFTENRGLGRPSCAIATEEEGWTFRVINCEEAITYSFLCEFSSTRNVPEPAGQNSEILVQPIDFNLSEITLRISTAIRCPKTHVTHDFLSCDPATDCFADTFVKTCQTESGGVTPQFICDDGVQTLAYTLVCDHKSDCNDDSDENGCVYEPCEGFLCDNLQCIPITEICDGLEHCLTGKDEYYCSDVTSLYSSAYNYITRVVSTAIITLDGRGSYKITDSYQSEKQTCPSTHFRCPSWHCLPIFLLCNGMEDCPRGEDEVNCHTLLCPGYYRCRHHTICLHPKQVCDGVFHCPQQDDERFCLLSCPLECQCQGLSFTCSRPFVAERHPEIRYLNASGSGMTAEDLRNNFYLVGLVLSRCHIYDVKNFTFQNLRELDLSYNFLQTVRLDSFDGLNNLRTLILSWNPVTVIVASSTQNINRYLLQLDMAGLQLKLLDVEPLSRVFPNIERLNLSSGQFDTVTSFDVMSELKLLDLTNTPVVNFPSTVFTGLQKLSQVHTDNYKLCCRQIIPTSLRSKRCFSPVDEISSCDNLLRSPVYRAFLWLFALVAILGNGFSFVIRLCVQKNAFRTGFGVFVTGLSLSDFLMGVYLAMIGVADQVFYGSYLWEERQWRQSATCKAAGFLSMLSSEVSVFIVCLITLDRFLVMRFPFSQRRFRSPTAALACGFAWLLGFIIALVPLLPVTSHWEFYSQTGICIPLPIVREEFLGRMYSYGVLIDLNLVLFLVIAVGQVLVFCSIRGNRMKSTSSTSASRDLVIAQRLAVIVVSDFLCWFPVGLLGTLSFQGVTIPGELNVGIAIFVLPINSALNPFLYTVNAVLAKRKERRRKKIMKALEARIRSEIESGFHVGNAASSLRAVAPMWLRLIYQWRLSS